MHEHYTYILYSVRLSQLYLGHPRSIADRLSYHNGGHEAHTSKGNPWILLWFTKKESKFQAMTLEKKLKNLSRSRKILFMLKYNEGLQVGEEFLKKFEP